MRHHLHFLFVALLLPGLASAEIYRWTDAQGRVHFGEKPGGNGAQQVEVKPQVVERDEATRQREQRTQQYFDARRDERDQANARASQARAERAQECSKLRNSLAQIQHGGLYYRTDEKGERSYYSDEQMDAARSRLSSRIAERCG
ncbi:DUF4124 domain-containing protein [Pseudomonas sp. Gutcm_11s]|uniref:DUF4124 domain-containing protein n=1 Tax=Pseudomonas sp. Gutcm_11s TaxID=3026088 RepID=UPI002361834F|nr:DUF4124 domain-containing protein [Pseudomonas sp. Gutcm_11s]MDD0841383.1 DUF4124 domain-containing protein [Pseudomonas sp. Gutcm_11s]